jgi:hypothetical protein
MKTLRFCGVTARRGARGPKETDPDPRDFMYSYYYDFVSSKEEYNRRKLCAYGYSKEAREIAGQHKGEFLNSEWMPKRKDLLKAAAESRAAAGPICHGAAGAGASAGGGAAAGGAGIGLDVLWEVVSKDFGQYNPKDRGAPQGNRGCFREAVEKCVCLCVCVCVSVCVSLCVCLCVCVCGPRLSQCCSTDVLWGVLQAAVSAVTAVRSPIRAFGIRLPRCSWLHYVSRPRSSRMSQGLIAVVLLAKLTFFFFC